MGVVVAEEPVDGAVQAVGPPAVAGQLEGPPAGVGQRCHLDRLLVEGGPGLPRSPTTHWCHREVALEGLQVEQPPQKSKAVSQHVVIGQPPPGRDQRFSDRGVGVGQARLRPRPLAS